MNRHDAIGSLRLIEAELEATRLSLHTTLRAAEHDPPRAIDASAVSLSDLRRALLNVERTFCIVLFARFEAVLREYWATFRNTEPAMRALLDGIASRERMPVDRLDDAHRVREFRNSLVHEGVQTPALTFIDCRSRLCRFLAWLPPRW